AARRSVQSLVCELREVLPDSRLLQSTTSLPLLPANLEDIRVVSGKLDCQADFERGQREIPHVDALVAGTVPDELRAIDVEATARQDVPVPEVDVGIGQVAAEHKIAPPYRGRQQQRTCTGK